MENKDQKIYSTKSLLALGAAIGHDELAFNWLLESDDKELAALADMLVYVKTSAFDWLKNNGFNHLVAFIGALEEDEESINYLNMNHGKNWLATAESVNGSGAADEWLEQYFPDFAKLAALMSESATGAGRFGYSRARSSYSRALW